MTDHNHHDPMQQLRKLLFKEEEARISAIEEVRDNEELHAKEISEVLVEALDLRAHDEGLGKALMPAVETAVSESIANDPKAFADALFPVMGPAIRRSIQYAISEMLQSLNQTLEQAFSPKSMLWRWEAFRTGKSFAEVVMLNTLLYRVEQVFWIHKETGLLLAHESFDPSLTEDADVVSSMLTAVGDFIQDSFQGSPNQEVQSLRLGDLEVMIEQGPYSVLAVVCRGNPPRSLQVTLGQTLEHLLQTFHDVLKTFDGDTSHFSASHDMLAPLLLVDYVDHEKKPPIKLIIALSILVISFVGWTSWNVEQKLALKHRWQSYIQTLKETPGLVITDVDEHEGIHHIYGLRDPLAIQAASLLKKFELNEAGVQYHFQPYHALDHGMMLKRLWHLSKAPSSVSFKIQDDVLYVYGKASQAWLSELQLMTQWMDGIALVNVDAVDVPKPPKTFQERVMMLWQPIDSVQLHVQGDAVMLTGSATIAWLQQAKARLASLKDMASYDDHAVLRLDSVDYILQLAQQALHPPRGVHLSITKEHILKAQGAASASWIANAQKKSVALKYILGFDAKDLKILNKVNLARVIAALEPPASVDLFLNKGKLLVKGEADGRWITFANLQALNIKGVQSFQNQVKQIWHADAVLEQAKLRLHPEPSVQLSFADGVLHARGQASKRWISFVHREALHIDGVFTFDEQVDMIYSDEEILKIAMTTLQPPEGVRLQVSQGVLSILGEADIAWIESLKAQVAVIPGLQSFDIKSLHAKAQADGWEQLQIQVASTRLQTFANHPLLTVKDEAALKRLSNIFHRAVELHPDSRLHLAIAYKRSEKLVLMMRNHAIHQGLKKYGVFESQIITDFSENQGVKQDSRIVFTVIKQP
ncbi:MAG: hypothetical protein Q9M15_01270 [Mariprofundaceae bacterium]|nr:hypothetical protein [Mariprofundaceae bacterium]